MLGVRKGEIMSRGRNFVASLGWFFAAILIVGFSATAIAQEIQPDVCGVKCGPRIPIIAGSYTGSFNDADSGQGTISMTIQQKGKHITGIWGISYQDGQGNGGTLNGTVSKKAVHAKLTTQVKHCFYTVLISISASSFDGTYANNRRCPEEDSGHFTIPRFQD
jgi:hypothetical protein